ncbi:MAG: dialkylresorcinol condensing enzyme DarA [Bacteroidetes bacterium]|nr:dialkylresorcinol condensing enzyme DarA [Bacteroidota bacterium]
MKKNILVIYFTQTGQARKALDSVLAPFTNNPDYTVHYELIEPAVPFPHPWKYTEFFDAFPENVQAIPCELKPIKADMNLNYDLVFIAYQPWFLSICRPILSFLVSPQAKQLLKGKPVITIINCRNMWLNAQEKMKRRLLDVDAKLVGNITFVDHSANLISLVTVLAHVLKGEKGRYLGIFPKYGVNEKDIANGQEFGKIIVAHTQTNNWESLQKELNAKGALDIRGNLMLMEGRGNALFPLYANYISKRGTAGSKQRRTRVRIFGIVLPTAILILSPVITILSRLAPLLAAGKFKKQIAYYSQNALKK